MRQPARHFEEPPIAKRVPPAAGQRRASLAHHPTMLTIFGNQSSGHFCDRLGRRDFLTIGGMALGGLALPQMLRAESQPGGRSHKAIINVYLPGGPPHIDMWDLKPDAPAEIRGEYSPIKTSVPGMEICE